VQTLRAQGRVNESGDFAIVAKLMGLGRVDAMLAVPHGWAEVAAAFDRPDELVTLDWAPKDRALASLVMTREGVSAADRRRLHEAMERMLKDGSVFEIMKRHAGEKVARASRYHAGE
jgi:polar amino acid transport system substrate-binding protein